MRRWPAAVVVSFSVLLTGGAAPAAQPAFDLWATVARFDRLEISITGDVAELRASDLVNYHRIEVGVERCMHHHGRTSYRKPPYVDFYRDFTDDALGIGNGSARITDSLTAGTRRWELTVKAPQPPDRSVPPSDVHILNACAEPYEHRSYVGADPPAGAWRLSSYPGLLDLVDRDAEVLRKWARYPACMKSRYGYEIPKDRSDFLFAPAAKRDFAAMRVIFAADADCRRPAYVAAMRVVAANLDRWEAAHRAELRAVRKAWRSRVEAAAKLRRG